MDRIGWCLGLCLFVCLFLCLCSCLFVFVFVLVASLAAKLYVTEDDVEYGKCLLHLLPAWCICHQVGYVLEKTYIHIYTYTYLYISRQGTGFSFPYWYLLDSAPQLGEPAPLVEDVVNGVHMRPNRMYININRYGIDCATNW